MITLNHLVYDINNIAYGGRTSDDSSVSDRQVALWISEVRALLVRQELSKGKIQTAWIQHFPVDLEETDIMEDCDEDSGCTILRSVEPFPLTVVNGNRDGIISIESEDGAQTFTRTTTFRKKWHAYNKYTAKQKRYYLKNNHLYLYIPPGLPKDIERVLAGAILANPEDAGVYTCDDVPCFTWDSEYPVNADMAGIITDIILKTKMGIALAMPEDKKNDGAEDQPSGKV